MVKITYQKNQNILLVGTILAALFILLFFFTTKIGPVFLSDKLLHLNFAYWVVILTLTIMKNHDAFFIALLIIFAVEIYRSPITGGGNQIFEELTSPDEIFDFVAAFAGSLLGLGIYEKSKRRK